MEIYNVLDSYMKNIEDEKLKVNLKDQRDRIHQYLVNLEICDIPVREKQTQKVEKQI